MLRSNPIVILAALFVVPVLLCLVGVGAFLHVTNRAAAAADEQAREQVQHEKGKTERLTKAIENVEQRIEDIRKELQRMRQAETLQKDVAELQARKEELERELAALSAELKQIEDELRQTTVNRDELAQRLTDVRQRLEDLQRKLAALAPGPENQPAGEQAKGPSAEELARRIAEANRRLEQQRLKNEQAQAELDGLRQETSPTDPRIRVENIAGSTDWQSPSNPLYVECDDEGVVFQPENVRASATPDGSEKTRFTQLARQRGYVLFLIRPSGYTSFHHYRALAVQENVFYGYEPINQDGKVIYPAAKRKQP